MVRRFGYACFTERFGHTLAQLPEHLDYLKDLGVNYLHLMPLLRPRPGDNDGGYAVQSYRDVRADLGGVEDLRDLATTVRGEGITLVLDAPERTNGVRLQRDRPLVVVRPPSLRRGGN